MKSSPKFPAKINIQISDVLAPFCHSPLVSGPMPMLTHMMCEMCQIWVVVKMVDTSPEGNFLLGIFYFPFEQNMD